MTKLKLWKFSKDYGRYGEVEGLFIATEKEVNQFLKDKEINFGEILGKYSEVSICFDKENLKCLDVSESTIKELFIAVNSRSIAGYNPFEYIYDWIKCSDCNFEGNFYDWFGTKLLTANFYCPECGFENYKIEE